MKLVLSIALSGLTFSQLVAGPVGYQEGELSLVGNILYPEFIAVEGCQNEPSLEGRIRLIKAFVDDPENRKQLQVRGRPLRGTMASFCRLQAVSKNLAIANEETLRQASNYLDASSPKVRAIAAIACCDYLELRRIDLPSYISDIVFDVESRAKFHRRIRQTTKK